VRVPVNQFFGRRSPAVDNFMKNPVADKIRISETVWDNLKRVGIARADALHKAQIPLSILRDQALNRPGFRGG
jgi:hypothetical protein